MQLTDSAIFRRFVETNGKSQRHAERARAHVPTGTSRALLRHAPFPFYTVKGEGAYTTDLDGNRRIDFHGNYTAMIHGHADPEITAAVVARLPTGTAYSSPSVDEEALAALLCERVSSIDQVVFNNSGSEAVMVALRAARAVTGRNRIGRFEGGYHGSSDFMLTGGHHLPAIDDPMLVSTPQPDFAGLPRAACEDVVLMRYNSPEAVVEAVQRHGQELAAIIVEPMLGAGGIIPADPEFLRVLRDETRRAGIVLICDEVITLRQAVGGAQSLYQLEPDLTTMAKIIGGGFPIGAVGGKREFMRCFNEPERGGTTANLGTFSANAISVTAGLTAMRKLDASTIARLNQLGDHTRQAVAKVLTVHAPGAQVSGAGSLFQVHWTRAPLRDARAVESADQTLKLLTCLGLANRGIHISVRGMGALSTPMTEEHVALLVDALEGTLREMASEGWNLGL
jgi:glutamate-1-semialdehyde 2,1-aminomutase